MDPGQPDPSTASSPRPTPGSRHWPCGASSPTSRRPAGSLLLDLDSATWRGDLLELFGLADEPLPEIVACDQIVGETTTFGETPIPVAGLVVDQQAALLAEACLDFGAAKCTYGTGAFLLAQLGGNAARSAAGLTTSVAWTLRDRTSYCADGQVYTAASAVRWAVDLGLIPAADQLDTVSAADSPESLRAGAGRAGRPGGTPRPPPRSPA